MTMTKTVTVAEAMSALAQSVAPTPAPTAVRIIHDKLTSAETGQLLLTLLIQWPIRALAVWAFLAVFLPALGVTYAAVLFGLWALNFLLPPKVEAMAKGIIARRK